MNSAEYRVKALSRRVALARSGLWYASLGSPSSALIEARAILSILRPLHAQLEAAKAVLPKKIV